MAAESTLGTSPWDGLLTSRKWWCLGLGAGLSFLAVGGRWDLALSAWVAPVLLLRFSRDSGAANAIAGLLLVSIANVTWWSAQLGVPLQTSVIVFNVLLGLIFALPYVADRLLTARLTTAGQLLLLPAAMVACEFCVGTVSPLGTSYGLHAVTQSDNLALLQVTSVTGPYGIGFLIGLAATVVNHAWMHPHRKVARRYLIAMAALLATVIAGGQARLAFSTPSPDTARVKVAGITPSIVQRDVANEAVRRASFPPSAADVAAADTPNALTQYRRVQDELIARTREAARAGAQIVVWSETAAPAAADQIPPLLARARAVAEEFGIYVDVAIGVPFTSNETHLVAPDGRLLWSYRKNHPVPGMEPVPPSDDPVPTVDTLFGKLSNVICFDADFPALTRVPAGVLLVPGWDWPEMGRTHTLKMARLRAIENGYSLVRVDYNGESAAFDYLGNVLATQDTTPRAAGHMLMADVPVRGVATLYCAVGDAFAWLCLVGLITLIGRATMHRERGRR